MLWKIWDVIARLKYGLKIIIKGTILGGVPIDLINGKEKQPTLAKNINTVINFDIIVYNRFKFIN